MIKLFAASFVEFFFFFLAPALAMHHIELTRAEPLAFFRSHENACERKKKKKQQLFFLLAPWFFHLPLEAQTARERFTSILGRAAARRVRGRGEEDTHMGPTELVVCGRGFGDGGVGCWWGAGSQGGYGCRMTIEQVAPELSFQAGLSTLRVRYKDGMLLIPVMPTCLKPSHLLPKADTRPDHQSEPPKRSHCHRRASRSGTVHLARMPPRSRHAIYFTP